MSTNNEFDSINHRCEAEVFDRSIIPSKELYLLDHTQLFFIPPAIRSMLEEISAIESEGHFGLEALSGSQLLGFLTSRNATNVLLRDKELGRVVGFVFAIPTEEAYSINYPHRQHRQPSVDTAYIADTAISKSYQGHHLVGKMMHVLEEALRGKGYHYVERDSSMANNYASNIKKNYQGSIVAESLPQPSPVGPQVFFRIRL